MPTDPVFQDDFKNSQKENCNSLQRQDLDRAKNCASSQASNESPAAAQNSSDQKIKEVEPPASQTSLAKPNQTCDNSQADSARDNSINSKPSQENFEKKAENILSYAEFVQVNEQPIMAIMTDEAENWLATKCAWFSGCIEISSNFINGNDDTGYKAYWDYPFFGGKKHTELPKVQIVVIFYDFRAGTSFFSDSNRHLLEAIYTKHNGQKFEHQSKPRIPMAKNVQSVSSSANDTKKRGAVQKKDDQEKREKTIAANAIFETVFDTFAPRYGQGKHDAMIQAYLDRKGLGIVRLELSKYPTITVVEKSQVIGTLQAKFQADRTIKGQFYYYVQQCPALTYTLVKAINFETLEPVGIQVIFEDVALVKADAKDKYKKRIFLRKDKHQTGAVLPIMPLPAPGKLPKNHVVIFCEGVATGLSIFLAIESLKKFGIEFTVIPCINVQNLAVIAHLAREKWGHDFTGIIACDRDDYSENPEFIVGTKEFEASKKRAELVSPGLEVLIKCESASLSYLAAIPLTEKGRGKDFNDLFQDLQGGKNCVRNQIFSQLHPHLQEIYSSKGLPDHIQTELGDLLPLLEPIQSAQAAALTAYYDKVRELKQAKTKDTKPNEATFECGEDAKKQTADAPNTTTQKTKPKPTITEKDGRMFSVSYDKEGNETVEEISNFTITPIQEILEINEDYAYELEISIKGSDDKVEKKITIIPASSMTKAADFAQFLMRKCGKVSYGVESKKLHNEVLETCIYSKQIPHAKKSAILGMIEDDQGKPAGFLTHREFVKPNGEIISLQDCGLIPPKEENKKPVRIAKLSADEQVNILQTVVNEIYITLGFKMIWRFFGWAVATLFAKAIFEDSGHNPLLYFFGKHQSGKTVHANILQGMFGAHLIPQTNFLSSQKGDSRVLGQYSCSPVILNEFQSNEKNNSFLCSIFDRQGYTIAKKSQDMGVITFPVNAGVVIAGTFFPSGAKSEDVLSRMITINFDQSTRSKTFRYIRTREFMEKISVFVPFCLAHIDPANLIQEIKAEESRISEEVEKLNGDMAKHDERTIKNMAILGACYKAFINALASQIQDAAAFKEKFLDAAIDVSIVQTAIDQYQETGDNDIAVNFIQNLVSLVSLDSARPDMNGNLLPGKFSDMVKIETGEQTTTISFRYKVIFQYVKIFARQQNQEIPDQKTVRLAIERRFNVNKNVNVRFGEAQHKCDIIVVDNNLLE